MAGRSGWAQQSGAWLGTPEELLTAKAEHDAYFIGMYYAWSDDTPRIS